MGQTADDGAIDGVFSKQKLLCFALLSLSLTFLMFSQFALCCRCRCVSLSLSETLRRVLFRMSYAVLALYGVLSAHIDELTLSVSFWLSLLMLIDAAQSFLRRS